MTDKPDALTDSERYRRRAYFWEYVLVEGFHVRIDPDSDSEWIVLLVDCYDGKGDRRYEVTANEAVEGHSMVGVAVDLATEGWEFPW